ncbi:MAG: hypothetical protein MK008_06735 [Bdellovibrionales bacterium]|nr:hypothetical protein [Bdellovibrionales bacterium]
MILLNNKGFSLTEALVSAALLGAVFLSVMFGVNNINKQQNHTRRMHSSELIKNSLYSILNNPEAWKHTQNDNSNSVFNCLDSEDGCKNKSGYINIVRNSNNSVYFKDDGDSGFKSNGKQCSKSRDGEECYLTVKLKVDFLCNKNCKSPLAKISGNFYYFNNQQSNNTINHINFQLLKALKIDECALGCRTEVLTPTLSNADKEINLDAQELKVVMIVDNSSSMKSAQEYLSQGIRPLLSRIRALGIKVSFYVYSTTQFHNDGDNHIADYNRFYRYTDENGIYRETTSDPGYYGGFQYDVEKTITPSLRDPIGGVMTIDSDMSEDEFNQFEDKITSVISDEIGIHGDSKERGLCTLSRTLFDKGNNQFLSAGDNVLFLVVTDENDESETANSCYSKLVKKRDCDAKYGTYYSYNQCDQSNTAECDRVKYRVWAVDALQKVSRRKIWATCENRYIADGTELVETSTEYTYRDVHDKSCSEIPFGEGICNADDITRVREKTSCSTEEEVITSCKTSCYEYNSYSTEYNDYNKDTLGKNLMFNSFTTSGGNTYSNLIEYMEAKHPDREFNTTEYRRYGYKEATRCDELPYEYSSYQEDMGFSPETTSLKDVIKMKADSMFGADGYSLSLIINDKELNEQVGCALQGAQSFGTEYLNLANDLYIPGGVSSICSADYSSALNNVGAFAQKVANESFKTLVLSPGEQLIRITGINKTGETYTLSTPEDYIVNGLVITFTDSFVAKNTNPVDVRIGKIPPKLNAIKPAWLTSNQSNENL